MTRITSPSCSLYECSAEFEYSQFFLCEIKLHNRHQTNTRIKYENTYTKTKNATALHTYYSVQARHNIYKYLC